MQIFGHQIRDGAIVGSKIAADAVTGAKVQDGSLTGADLQDASVGEGKLLYDTKYKTIYRSFTDMWLDSQNPPGWATWRGQQVLAFDDTTVEKAGFSFEIPSDAKVSTALLLRVKFVCPATGGMVVWRSYFTWANEWTVFSAAGYSGNFAGSVGTADYLIIGQGSLGLANVNPRATFSMLFERYATHTSDTHVGDAYLLGVGIRYESDKRGLTS